MTFRSSASYPHRRVYGTKLTTLDLQGHNLLWKGEILASDYYIKQGRITLNWTETE
jgi:hypothetical protein